MVETVSNSEFSESRRIRGRMLRTVMATLGQDSRTKIGDEDKRDDVIAPGKTLAIENVTGYGRVCITAAHNTVCVSGYEDTGFVQVIIEPPKILDGLTAHTFYGGEIRYDFHGKSGNICITDLDGDNEANLAVLRKKEVELADALTAVEASGWQTAD